AGAALADQFRAQDAGEQAVRNRRRLQDARAFIEEERGDGAFAGVAVFVEEEDLVGVGGRVFAAGRLVDVPPAGLVAQQDVSRGQLRRGDGEAPDGFFGKN